MARYRLMLLDAPPRHAAALDELEHSLPEGVDAAAFRGLREGTFADPVLLGSSDELATLEAATATLQKAGLAVCVVDDSTPWIRLVETVRSTLGFTTVHVADARAASPQPVSSLPPSKPAEAHGPTLRDPRNSIWLRGALVLGALVLPMAGALLASTFLGDALYDAPTPASSTTPESASGHGRGRRLSMRSGAGRAGGSGVSERSPGGRGGAGGSAPSVGAANGDSIELSQDAPTGEADATPAAPSRRSARRAIAAIVAALLGLATAALAGEAVERSTRSKGARFRRRLRMAVAGMAGAGALVAPIALWQARASERPAAVVASSEAPPARPIEPIARPPSPTRPGDRCTGGPFARFLCRSHRPPAPAAREPHPFASLLAGYRQRAAHSPDAGVAADVVLAAAAPPERRAHHERRHHHHREPVAPTEATASSAQATQVVPDASAPIEAPAAPEAMTATAPAAPAAEAAETPAMEETETPAPAVVEAPRRRPIAKGWLSGWFGIGLALGLLGAPGWRRLGKEEA